ncbi:hypothetical protein [Mesorhizobium sp. M0047]|uniref:ATP-dependent DNA ligase n=1 Tax=Mesorhizobium sp. M0047 TaxID=2956859 RepID=UPI00333BDAA5
MARGAGWRWSPGKIIFVAFDLLHLNGKDSRREPLWQRRERLLELIGPGDGVLQYSQHISGGGAEFYAAVDRLDLEGMVSKRPGSVYVSSLGSAILVYMATKDFLPDLWPADLNNRRMGCAVLRWKAGLMSAANAVRVLRNPSLETEAELPGALRALFALL